MATIEAVEDCWGAGNGAAYTTHTANTLYFRCHGAAVNERWFAARFEIPEATYDAWAAGTGVTAATLVGVVAQDNVSKTLKGHLKVGPDTGVFSASNDPYEIATNDFSARDEVDVTIANGISVAAEWTSEDFANALDDALTDAVLDVDKYILTVVVYDPWQDATQNNGEFYRFYSTEHATLAPLKLDFTYDIPVANQTLTQTSTIASGESFNESQIFPYEIDATDVQATPNADSSTLREYDVYVPTGGGAPAAGYPTAVYVHGGLWTTGSKDLAAGENYLYQPFVEALTSAGYAVLSIDYRKCQDSLTNTNIFYSFPQNVHDVLSCVVHAQTNGNTNWDLDPERFVICGHSAGGHLAAFAGLSAMRNSSGGGALGDKLTYTGKQASTDPFNAGSRPAGYGYGDTDNPWQFDFDEFGQLELVYPLKGIMMWDAPVDLWLTASHNDPFPTAKAVARKALHGQWRTAGSNVRNPPAEADTDADINHYIDGTGNPYDTAFDPDDIPPIYYQYAISGTLIGEVGGLTPLETALDAVSYDTTAADGVVSATGFTQYGVAEPHEDVLRDSDFALEIEWLDAVSVATIPASTLTQTTRIASGESFFTGTLTNVFWDTRINGWDLGTTWVKLDVGNGETYGWGIGAGATAWTNGNKTVHRYKAANVGFQVGIESTTKFTPYNVLEITSERVELANTISYSVSSDTATITYNPTTNGIAQWDRLGFEFSGTTVDATYLIDSVNGTTDFTLLLDDTSHDSDSGTCTIHEFQSGAVSSRISDGGNLVVPQTNLGTGFRFEIYTNSSHSGGSPAALWPAAWARSTLPAAGELDLYEGFAASDGYNFRQGSFFDTGSGYEGENGLSPRYAGSLFAVEVIEISGTESHVQYTINDVIVPQDGADYRVVNNDTGWMDVGWDFIVNVAVGGAYHADPTFDIYNGTTRNGDTTLPARTAWDWDGDSTFLIDHVRITEIAAFSSTTAHGAYLFGEASSNTQPEGEVFAAYKDNGIWSSWISGSGTVTSTALHFDSVSDPENFYRHYINGTDYAELHHVVNASDRQQAPTEAMFFRCTYIVGIMPTNSILIATMATESGITSSIELDTSGEVWLRSGVSSSGKQSLGTVALGEDFQIAMDFWPDLESVARARFFTRVGSGYVKQSEETVALAFTDQEFINSKAGITYLSGGTTEAELYTANFNIQNFTPATGSLNIDNQWLLQAAPIQAGPTIIGSATITPGNVDLTQTLTISSAESFFTGNITTTVDIPQTSTIVSAESFFTGNIVPGNVDLTQTTFIATAGTFFVGNLDAPALLTQTSTITSAEAFFAGTLALNIDLQQTGIIASLEQFYTGAVTNPPPAAAPQTVTQHTSIPSAESFFTGNMMFDQILGQTTFIPSGEAFFVSIIYKEKFLYQLVKIGTGFTAFTGNIAVGGVSISGTGSIASAESFFTGNLLRGIVTLTQTATIDSLESFFTGSIEQSNFPQTLEQAALLDFSGTIYGGWVYDPADLPEGGSRRPSVPSLPTHPSI